MFTILKNSMSLLFVILFIAPIAQATQANPVANKTVGIVNDFPTYPNYYYVKSTKLTPHPDLINDPKYQQRLIDNVKTFFESKGYQVKQFPKKTEQTVQQVNVFIELKPREMKDMYGTYGYGVNLRNFFGVDRNYVYMGLSMPYYLQGKKQWFRSKHIEKKTIIRDKNLAHRWDALSPQQQQNIDHELVKIIDEVVPSLLNQLDL